LKELENGEKIFYLNIEMKMRRQGGDKIGLKKLLDEN